MGFRWHRELWKALQQGRDLLGQDDIFEASRTWKGVLERGLKKQTTPGACLKMGR